MDLAPNIMHVQGFPELFRVYLAKAGFPKGKYRAFARLARCSASTVAECASGKRAPPESALPRWAKLLGLSPEVTADFIFAGSRKKAEAEPQARQYIRLADKALEEAAEKVRAAEKNQQDLVRIYGEQKAEAQWGRERIAQLEAELMRHGLPLPPPPPLRLGDAPPDSSG